MIFYYTPSPMVFQIGCREPPFPLPIRYTEKAQFGLNSRRTMAKRARWVKAKAGAATNRVIDRMEEKAGRRNRLRCAASLLGRSEPAQRFTPVTGMPFNKNICRHRLALAPYDPTAVHERFTTIALIYGDAAPGGL